MRQDEEIEDTLLLLEHPPVLTLGIRGKQSNILVPQQTLKARGVSIHEIDRGGDVTYHGPGQIVGYPILDLNHHGRDIGEFVWKIEEIFIKLLKEKYHIIGYRDLKYRGIWVENKKIAAVGIGVKRWVTMHGFAFNVNTDLDHFKWIRPCGITEKGTTSLEKLLGHPEDFAKVMDQVMEYFCKVFDSQPEMIESQKLYQLTGGD